LIKIFWDFCQFPAKNWRFSQKTMLLANFSPMCDCLLLALFLKIAESIPHFRLPFPLLRLCIIFDKNVLGYILGDFLLQTHPVTLNGSEMFQAIHLLVRSLCRVTRCLGEKSPKMWPNPHFVKFVT
jgi:hypothetical protein